MLRLLPNICLASVLSVGLSAGCAVPIPTGRVTTNGGWEWTDSAEVATLSSLYDYAAAFRKLSSADRLQRYRELSAIDAGRRSIEQRLQRELLLSGVEPELVDYAAASEELRAARRQAADRPLLLGYVNERLERAGRLQRLDLTSQQLRQENIILKRRVRANGRAQSAPPAAEPAPRPKPSDGPQLANQEANDDTPQDRPAPVPFGRHFADSEIQLQLDITKAELLAARAELERRGTVIDEQDAKIEVLEAKIKALSAIERNLNQRDDL